MLGQTGHTEAVLIIYDAGIVPLEALLKIFWEEHDPTQAMRQGNDRGTQYRTALYLDDDESLGVRASDSTDIWSGAGKCRIWRYHHQIRKEDNFFYAEDYHQQYLHKNPNGYCGLAGCQVSADFRL